MLLITLQQVAILFVYMLIGFFFRRRGILPDDTAAVLSKLELYLFVPCLTFQTFAANFTLDKLTSDTELMTASLISVTITCVIGTFIGRHITKNHYEQNLCIYSINMPNTGYVGTPLVLALFGGDTLMKMMLFCIPFTIYTYSEGVRLLLNRKGFSLRSIANPPLISMLLGAAVGLLRLPIPSIAGNILSGCSGCLAPVAMVLTGCIIAGFRFRELLGDPHVYEVVAVRMIAVPIVVLTIARLFGISHELLIILAAVFTMPTGLNTVVLPSTIGKDCRMGAGMACVSNTLAILTIPLFFAIFL
ncbi:MAG: AEC family transporter [Oscillospiraceae bacterium]|nr:AEC family transporter [Oscillospiraceae bacterium]